MALREKPTKEHFSPFKILQKVLHELQTLKSLSLTLAHYIIENQGKYSFQPKMVTDAEYYLVASFPCIQ